ncbi:MAG: hypothetical protein MJE12_20975 [Alphaproteobacteria bacterium]|nr:hypothetical protein [Alphaproteobacteria bacterium]
MRPEFKATSFEEVEIGSLIRLEAGGTDHWALKCREQNLENGFLALFLGPSFPYEWSYPWFDPIENSKTVLDFGKGFELDLRHILNELRTHLPGVHNITPGIAIVEQKLFFRLRYPDERGSAMVSFLDSKTGEISKKLPPGANAFSPGWTVGLPDRSMDSGLITVVNYCPNAD